MATVIEDQLSDRDPQQLHILHRIANGLFKLRNAWMQEDWESMSVLLDSKSSLLQIKGDVAAEEIVPKEVLVELDLAKHEIQYHSLVSKAELVLKDMSDNSRSGNWRTS